MQELSLTPSTLILLAVIAALAILAVHRLVKRGMCDCGDHKGSGDACRQCAKGCASGCSCSAADDMVARMDKAARKDDGPKLVVPIPFAHAKR